MATLEATERTETGRHAGALLDTGRMPAVVYGPKQDSIAISVDSREFERVLKSAGESTVVALTGLGKELQVLIHEVDRDPVTNTPRHADFYAVEKGAKVEVAVPLSFIGESQAVKLGANLVKVLHEVEVEAAPADLPHEIEVDISVLGAVGDQILAGGLTMPRGVTLTTDPEEVIALTQEVAAEEPEEVAAVDMSAIEVEQKGKAEGEEEAAA